MFQHCDDNYGSEYVNDGESNYDDVSECHIHNAGLYLQSLIDTEHHGG